MGAPGRLARLREAMQQRGLAAMLVSQTESRRYLSGYTATDIPPRESAGYLLISDSRQYLLTDPRTEALARTEAPGFELRVYGGGTPWTDVLKDTAAEALRGTPAPARTVGFEAAHLTVTLWRAMSDVLEGIASLEPAPDLVDELRIIKDDDELAALRESI